MISLMLNGIATKASGWKCLSFGRQLQTSAFLNAAEKCDTGKCKRRDNLIKQMINSKDYNYLQPSKKQVSLEYRFKEGKPIVKPVIDLTLEKNCRILEECKKMHVSQKKGDK